MPTYPYECEACGHAYEEFRFIEEPGPQVCPKCEATPPSFHQVFAGAVFNGFVRGEPKTFGQQAELNAKRLGKELLQKKKEEMDRRTPYTGPLPEGASVATPTNEIPWHRSGVVKGVPKMEKPLDLRKVKDTTHYMMTGETK